MLHFQVLEPSIGGRERRYVNDCLKTGWIGSWGKYIGAFEDAFAHAVGVPYASGTANGTVSLHLILLALGVGPGDEVIVPAFTYVASANAVLYVGATPVFVDCEPDTYNIDPNTIERAITRRTKAIMPVHIFGNPCRMDEIMKISRRRGIPVIEDAAQAHGSRYRGQVMGSFGIAASFSFFGTKTITTGEGGMVVTKSKRLADAVRLIKNQGQPATGRRYYHVILGYNYRMTNIEAAIGLAQLERLPSFLRAKQNIHGWYRRFLAEAARSGAVSFQSETPGSRSSWWVSTLTMPGRDASALARYLKRFNIETRPFFFPMNELSYMPRSGRFPETRRLSREGIILPSSVNLKAGDIQFISNKIVEFLAA